MQHQKDFKRQCPHDWIPYYRPGGGDLVSLMPGCVCRKVKDSNLETFMAVVQRTGAGSNPRISRVVSKSDRDHRTATTDNRTLGLKPADTICRRNLSLGSYPLVMDFSGTPNHGSTCNIKRTSKGSAHTTGYRTTGLEGGGGDLGCIPETFYLRKIYHI